MSSNVSDKSNGIRNFKFSSLSYKKQQKVIIILFSIVPLILLVTFSYLPLFNMFSYSFTDWDGLSPNREFIGLQNYIRLFTTPQYFEVFKVSLYYLVGSFVQLALALYFATMLSFRVRFKNFFKGSLFFPYLLNGVAIGFTFLIFFRQDGTLDTLLSLVGLENFSQMWLRDPSIINISLASTSVWRHMGLNFIIFLGAISSISNEIYEAAEIDGANRWQQFRYIIFPSLRMIIQLNLILSISGALSVFEIPYIMTGGANGSSTFVIQTVDLAFKHNSTGLASAMGIVLFIIVMIVSLIQHLAFKEDN